MKAKPVLPPTYLFVAIVITVVLHLIVQVELFSIVFPGFNATRLIHV